MHFFNPRKKFSFSFLTFVFVLLSIVSITFGTVISSANSVDTRNNQKKSEAFEFLSFNPTTLFSGNDLNQSFSGSQASPSEASGGKTADSSVFDEFDAWVNSFVKSSDRDTSKPDGQQINEGARLAIERKELLKQLIGTNPKAALARAIPAEVFNRLPASITAHTERRISAEGDFLVYAIDGNNHFEDELGEDSSDLSAKKTEKMSGSRIEREVVIDEARYKAVVYGRRESMTTKLAIPLQGIVIDDIMVVDETPVRIISSAEYADRAWTINAPVLEGGEVATEIAGKVVRFSGQTELDEFLKEQIEWESKIGPVRAKQSSDERMLAPESATSTWTEGAKKVLVIRVDFADKQGEPLDRSNQPLTQTRAQNLFNNDISPFYVINSYNKTSMQTTVTPVVIRMPKPQTDYAPNNYSLMFTDARNAARSAGYDTNNYDLDVIAFSYLPGIPWAGLGFIGGKGSLINGVFDLRVTAHELGHNYGLEHANRWNSTDGTPSGQGTDGEYGDSFDMMGAGGGSQFHFNARYKRSLGWLTDANVQTITTNGTYRITAHDSSTAGGTRTLKIRKDAEKDYWIEFRQLFTTNSNVMNGALIRQDFAAGSSRKTQLLDMTPNTTAPGDEPLGIGQSFYDSINQIRFTVVGKGNTPPESLDVRVEFGQSTAPTPTPTPACTYSITPATQSFGSLGGTGSINVTAPNGCSWSAVSSQSFVSVTSGGSGSGNGTVSYSVEANTGSAGRSAAITIAGQIFTAQQAGAVVGIYTLTASPGIVNSGGQVTVNWTAPSGALPGDWITLYRVGASNFEYLGYVFTNGATSGNFSTVLTEAGQYEFRYLLSGGYTSVATSNTVTVQSAPTPTPTPVAGLEADIATGSNGNGLIQSNDVVRIRSLLTNCSALIDLTTNEFQRADSAPFATKGNGLLQSNDVVQARRYVNNSDLPQSAGGPTGSCPGALAEAADSEKSSDGSSGKAVEIAAPEGVARQVRVENASAAAGSTVTVNIRVDAAGDESEYAFILNYQAPLSNPVVGNGTAGSLLRDCNIATAGQVNCSVGGFPTNNPASGNAGIGEIGAGTNQLLITVTFNVAANATPGSTTPLSLTNVNASNDAAALVSITGMGGLVSITGPTAAEASIAGRVRNSSGAGIGGVQMTLLETRSGASRTTMTAADGGYRFEGLEVGGDYIITPKYGGYSFSPGSKQFSLIEDLAEVDFVAISKKTKRQW